VGVPGAFDAGRALALATELAGMGPRDAGTPGDPVARAWLADVWEAAGWTVFEESLELPQGGTTANVIAVRDPADVDAPHVVIGGHLDTRNQSPGANDNGSGIGVLVAIAEALTRDLPIPVVLVGFGAEEYQPTEPRVHHLGSDAYADRHVPHVIAAFIVDMVGNGPATCICWYDAGPQTLADRLDAVAEDQGLEGFHLEARGDISDHGPFARRRVPAAFLWTYDDGRYHTAADTPEHLDVVDLQRAGDLVLAFVRSLAEADVAGLRADP
jgi:Zn-dependent M28 family amino/carboxypeptidase